MKPDNIETEIKLYVPDLAAVATRMEALGATLTKPRVFERNVRYENATHTLTQQEIVVRLRQDTRVRLTYKEPAQTPVMGGIYTRFEAEVEVGDFDQMELILGRLGYTPAIIYEKWRTTYTFNTVEIVLDELPYGNFIEIEGGEEDIRATVSQLGLQHAPAYAESYLTLFDTVRRNLNLVCHDLTFANFEGVIVPPNAFTPPA